MCSKTLLSQVITSIKDSSYLANVATIELMSRVSKILATSNMYNGVGTQMVSDVFVLFGVAFAIAAILMLLTLLINLSASLVGKYFAKRRSV